jgi:hypothetical protein
MPRHTSRPNPLAHVLGSSPTVREGSGTEPGAGSDRILAFNYRFIDLLVCPPSQLSLASGRYPLPVLYLCLIRADLRPILFLAAPRKP